MLRRSSGIISAFLLASCAVGPNYQPPSTAALEVPAAFHSAPGAQAATPEQLASWSQQFNDPTLNALVSQAIAGNLDIQIAASRLRQAREAVVQARAQGLPNVTGSTGLGRNFDATHGTTTGAYNIGANASWEAGLFGRVSRSIEAARADEQAAGFDLASAHVSVIAEVVNNYIQARLAQQQLAIARDNLQIADSNLQIARWRVQAGLVSSLDVEQARAERAQTAATIPTFESNFAAATYRLGVLTGQPPAIFSELLATPRAIPAAPAGIAVGIPADTLRQRPDVRSAERTLAAATARIGVAEAQLYPDLQITGNIGTSALSPGGLFNLVTGGLFAGLAQTIFDGGRLHSQVRSQRAAAEGAFSSYKQTVLTALEDVENGLVALETARGRHAQFLEQYDAANNTAILARSEYRAGLTDFTTLLTAEQSLQSARNGVTSSQADEALAVVQLYRALGGGWNPLAAPDSEGRP